MIHKIYNRNLLFAQKPNDNYIWLMFVFAMLHVFLKHVYSNVDHSLFINKVDFQLFIQLIILSHDIQLYSAINEYINTVSCHQWYAIYGFLYLSCIIKNYHSKMVCFTNINLPNVFNWITATSNAFIQIKVSHNYLNYSIYFQLLHLKWYVFSGFQQ